MNAWMDLSATSTHGRLHVIVYIRTRLEWDPFNLFLCFSVFGFNENLLQPTLNIVALKTLPKIKYAFSSLTVMFPLMLLVP